MIKKNVGILLFPDIELLDFCGPYEVFSIVRINEDKRREEKSPFDIFLISERNEEIKTKAGMRVIPEYSFSNHPKLDILLIPGGWGIRKELNNENLIKWILEQSKNLELLTSVCTGSILLGKAGLLKGKHATTHWRSLDLLQELFPDTIVVRDLHYVEDGTIITSAGISAGIDMSLKVVARYFGDDIARATARHMEYTYPENNKRKI